MELPVTRRELNAAWLEINAKLWTGIEKFTPADWTARHTAVSEDDFKREPHRSRFTVLLGRTTHLAYHVGQAVLALPKK